MRYDTIRSCTIPYEDTSLAMTNLTVLPSQEIEEDALVLFCSLFQCLAMVFFFQLIFIL